MKTKNLKTKVKPTIFEGIFVEHFFYAWEINP